MQYYPLVILGAIFVRILDLRLKFLATRPTYNPKHQTDALNWFEKIL